jgi:hypothetical protein
MKKLYTYLFTLIIAPAFAQTTTQALVSKKADAIEQKVIA